MNLALIPFKKTLNKAYQKVKPNRTDIERFKANLSRLLDRIDHEESEENVKNHLRDFLNDTWYKDSYLVNTKGRTDLVIHEDKSAQSRAAVLFEVKRPKNATDMVSATTPNAKAMHELLLYYLRERIEHDNTDVRYLVITNVYEWYIFEGATFDRLFFQNKALVREYEKWRNGQKVQSTTDFFYKDIARPFLEQLQGEVPVAHVDFRNLKDFGNLANALLKPEPTKPETDRPLIPLFKIFSPQHLLRQSFANDSNSLDKGFYNELLYLIGLEEKKEGGKKLIQRCDPANRQPGSLLENTIATLEATERWQRMPKLSNYGANKDEQIFGIALELCITWMNRILFLKLLEAQLVKYHGESSSQLATGSHRFLQTDLLKDFDEVNELFFEVLAKTPDERAGYVQAKFRKIPYLNSSLFEISELEGNTLFISNLKDRFRIQPMGSTVLKDEKGKRRTNQLSILEYLFAFLDAYDFASEGSEEISEENKTLINASVLGLIFEKINGYRDGSFFTPGFITMYMCQETVRRAVIQKFNEHYGIDCNEFDDLKNFAAKRFKTADVLEMNRIVNSLRICDPAVGSGHFLVSALNEMLAVKSELGILADQKGEALAGIEAKVENDELIVTCNNGEDLFEYRLKNGTADAKSQRVQETLFHEKQTLIENCLFGVDINPNSVKICRLRLWIELLKNTYYKGGTENGGLETLPNIDINIKTGNSLISRFALDADLSKALKSVKYDINTYRRYVQEYHHATDKETKRGLLLLMEQIKSDFKTEIGSNDPKRKRLDKLLGEMYYRFTGNFLFEPDTPYGDETEDSLERKRLAEKARLEKEITALQGEMDEVKNNRIFENAFEWRFEFPEVLDAEGRFVGFDVVVGNPPYIPLENISENERMAFKNKYTLFERKYETSVLFIALGFELLKPTGLLSYIAPVTWQTGDNFSKFREYIFREKSIDKIVNLPFNIFEDAYVDTALYLFNNQKSQDYYQIYIFNKKDSPDDLNSLKFQPIQTDLITAPSFKVILNPFVFNILKRLRKEITTISLGEISISTQGLSPSEFPESKEINENIYPFLSEGNVYNYSLSVGQTYPTDMSNKLSLTRFYEAKPKLLIRRIINRRDRLDVGYTEQKMVFKKDINPFIPIDERFSPKYVLALLASKFISFLYINISSIATKDDFRQTTLSELREIPIPVIDVEAQKPFIERLDQILAQKQSDPQVNTTALEREIDERVYGLYGLTPEEISIIEQS